MGYFLSLVFILWLYMTFWFIVSLIKKRNDVADIAWGLGFVFLAWSAFFIFKDFNIRGLFVCFLITIWGLRLFLHIYFRNKEKKEDYRYLAWRKEWGKWFYIRSYFQVYLLQGFFLFLIIMPAIFVNKVSWPAFGFFDIFGFLIWIIGFYFEAIGDLQLVRFIKNPANKGKIMKTGLWSYTRHPNYFGEVMQWWGVWLIALSVPFGWVSIIGPITITFLILKVSGIPMLEKNMLKNPEFLEYKSKVSIFFPLPPKK